MVAMLGAPRVPGMGATPDSPERQAPRGGGSVAPARRTAMPRRSHDPAWADAALGRAPSQRAKGRHQPGKRQSSCRGHGGGAATSPCSAWDGPARGVMALKVPDTAAVTVIVGVGVLSAIALLGSGWTKVLSIIKLVKA